MDKLNEKRKEVVRTTDIATNNKSCDACINDLHKLIGSQKVVPIYNTTSDLQYWLPTSISDEETSLKPLRFANSKVSKWQEDELVKVLIKPQLYECVYAIGSVFR